MTNESPRRVRTREWISQVGGLLAGEEEPRLRVFGNLRRDARLWATIAGMAVGACALAAALMWQGGQAGEREREANARYAHTLDVLIEVGELSTALSETQRGARGYLLTGDPRSLAPYQRGLEDAPSHLRRLRLLTSDNPVQQKRLTTLEGETRELLDVSRREVALQSAGEHAAALAIAISGAPQVLMDLTFRSTAVVVAEEKRLLALRRTASAAATEEAGRMTLGLALLGAVSIVAGWALGWAAVTSDTRARVAAVRAQANERLARTGALLSLFVEEAPAAIAMFDREMRYLAVSRRFAADYGLAPDVELVGRSHYEVFSEIPQRWRDIHARVLAGETMSCDEDPFPRADGQMDWVRWRMEPWRDVRGEIGGALLFSELITRQVEAVRALHAAQAKHAAILETAADAIVVIDEAGVIQSANPATTRMFGYEADELVGQNVSMLMGEPERSRHDAYLARYRQTGERRIIGAGREVEVRRKDGSPLALDLSVAEWRDGEGRFFTGILRDISARKLAEAQRQEGERRELVVGELRHRITNMFAVINTLISATARSYDDVREYRDAVLARVSAFAASQLELARRSWTSRGLRELIAFELKPYQAADGRVSIDGEDLRLKGAAAESFAMALHELATNAAKYGSLSRPDATLSVRWRVVEDEPGGRRIVFEWIERGGPAVAPPGRRGFGSSLIESSARVLGGSARLHYEPEGLRCVIEAPAARLLAQDA